MVNILNTCDDIAFGSIIQVIKKLLNLIQIIGPLLSIISLVYLFIKYMQNKEDKKTPSKIKNSILALIILFFIPLIVNVVMNMVDESNTIASCWKSNVKVNNSSSYQQIENLYNSMQVPITSEIEELANKNYGMSKQNVERMIALVAKEGYFKDQYFAYLCDSTIVNIYLHHKEI